MAGICQQAEPEPKSLHSTNGTPSSASAGVQQQRRSCGVDSRDLCLDYRTGDLGIAQCLPQLALIALN